MKAYPELPYASWELSLPADLSNDDILKLQQEADRLGAEAQYGWGHTIAFGPFRKEGLLLDSYLKIAGGFDKFGWWPRSLKGMTVADIGCYTGGIALLMAQRGASRVYAIDEIPEHVAQCEFLAREFRMPAMQPVRASAYSLNKVIEPGSLDVVVFSGILYHLSDMLVGLHAVGELLRPGGTLLIESNGVDDSNHSYANFGRFYGGMWWQPSALCIRDMCEFMGFEDIEIQFYEQNRCIARAIRTARPLTYKRGLNWSFEDLRDRQLRSLDPRVMAPAPLAPNPNDA